MWPGETCLDLEFESPGFGALSQGPSASRAALCPWAIQVTRDIPATQHILRCPWILTKPHSVCTEEKDTVTDGCFPPVVTVTASICPGLSTLWETDCSGAITASGWPPPCGMAAQVTHWGPASKVLALVIPLSSARDPSQMASEEGGM